MYALCRPPWCIVRRAKGYCISINYGVTKHSAGMIYNAILIFDRLAGLA